MKKKIRVMSSFFWPTNNTNGLVISKKIYSLRNEYDFEVLTYDFESCNVIEDLDLINRAKKMNIKKISNGNKKLINRVLSVLKFVIKNNEKDQILYSYHHLYETSYACFFQKFFLGNNRNKWIAHLSDPPTFMSPFVKLSFKEKLKEVFISKIPFLLLKKYSDVIICNDVWQAEFIFGKDKNKYKEKIIINQMGFEEIERELEIDKKNNIVKFGYFGDLYGPRNGKEFFEGVRRFLRKNPNKKNEIFIYLYGNIEDENTKNMLENDVELKNVIFVRDRVSYSESLELMRKMDILLVIDGNLSNQIDIYPYTPSKIIDYLSLRKLIFGISMEKSPTREICEKTNNYWTNFEVSNIEKEFERCLKSYKIKIVDEKNYLYYSLENQNKKFKEIIGELIVDDKKTKEY